MSVDTRYGGGGAPLQCLFNWKPVLGDKSLGINIERVLGTLEGLTPSPLETRVWGQKYLGFV